MGFFRLANGEITIDNGLDLVRFSAEDAERCVPWVGQLPAAMIYTQGVDPPAYRLDKAIESIDRIREIILDSYWGLTLAQARVKRKGEIMEEIRDLMLEPKRLFEVLLPAIAGDEIAIGQLGNLMTIAKTKYQAAAAAIDAAATIPAVKAVELGI